MNGQNTGAAASNTPRWQASIAALSMALLSFVVLFPVAVTGLALWGGVLGIASAWSLNAVGARDTHVLEQSVAIAVALLGSAGGIAFVGATASGITKLDVWKKSRMGAQAQQRVVISPSNPGKKSWSSTLLGHPWLSLGGIALFVDGCVVPFHASRAIHLPPEVLGGFIITGASLLFLFALVLSFRAYVYGMRALWGGVRESAFFAGLVTAGSLVGAGIVLLIGHAFGQAASAFSSSETGQALQACSGSAECSRRVLQSALDGKPRQLPSSPAGGYSPERPTSFDQCVEELRRPEARGWSSIDWALFEANSIINDKAQAEDLVQGTLLTVCLMPERISAIKPYFIKSVKNAARMQWRKNKQTCPVVIDDPVWLVDQCITSSVEQQAIQIETETAAQLALCALSNDERRLIVWHAQQDFSHAQIAKKLGVNEDTARKRYSRALDALREQFTLRCQ